MPCLPKPGGWEQTLTSRWEVPWTWSNTTVQGCGQLKLVKLGSGHQRLGASRGSPSRGQSDMAKDTPPSCPAQQHPPNVV